MNCPNCQLTYTKQRKPLVYSCGHTFCSECVILGQVSTCFNCPFTGKPAINYAIFEHLVKKNTYNVDKYIKICLFGNMDVGKSSLLKRLIDDQFEYKMNPTIGIDFKYIDKEVEGKSYRFQIWDSAGQERYRAVASNHLKGADIVLLVYDLSAGPNQNGLGYWIREILNYSEHSNILLIGNKTDLENKRQQRCYTKEEEEIIEGKKWMHLQVSCLNRHNIDKLWEIILQMSQKAKGVSAQEKHKSVILAPPLEKKSTVKANIQRNSMKEKQGKCCKSN